MILAIEESMTVVSEVMDNVVISLKDDLRMELGHVLVIEDGNIFFAHPDIGQFVGQGTTKPPARTKTATMSHHCTGSKTLRTPSIESRTRMARILRNLCLKGTRLRNPHRRAKVVNGR